MRRRIGLALVAITLLFASSVEAADPKIEINPFAGVRFGGSISGGSYETLTEKLDFAEGDQYGVNVDIPFAMMGVGGTGGKSVMLEFMFNTSGATCNSSRATSTTCPSSFAIASKWTMGKSSSPSPGSCTCTEASSASSGPRA